MISKSLADQLTKEGEFVTLTFEVDGEGLTYVWEKDGILLLDSNLLQLQLASVVA